MEIVEELFGENARISMLTGVINGPGIQRGPVHADWPYNQDQYSRVRAPYPDVIMNLVTMWMLSRYTKANGGTIVVPRSHLHSNAPRQRTDLDPDSVFEDEIQIEGDPGDVAVFDARTWHSIAPNITEEERVGVIVRYAPWWLNLNPLRPGSRDRSQIVDDPGGSAATDPKVEPFPPPSTAACRQTCSPCSTTWWWRIRRRAPQVSRRLTDSRPHDPAHDRDKNP